MKPAEKAPGGGGPRKPGKPRAPKCAVCSNPVTQDYRPFCSKRCADIDLGRWLDGRYAIPGQPASPSDTDPDEA